MASSLPPPADWRSLARRYGVAVGSVVLAGLVRHFLIEFWGATFVPFIFYSSR